MKNYISENILGIQICVIPLTKIDKYIAKLIPLIGKKTFFYVNAHCINLANQDDEYREILNEATITYSGGIGPILASRLLGKKLMERTPTPDFINSIFNVAQEKNWSIYLLGSSNDTLQEVFLKLKVKFPKLKVSGYHNGFFSPYEEKKLIEDINSRKPTILLVGLGPPVQEKWIKKNIHKLDVKVLWGVGALFEVISNKHPRAPHWMQSLGMEWLYRLFQEPKRLWKRYTIGNIQFAYLVTKHLIIKTLKN